MEAKKHACARSGQLIEAREGAVMASRVTGEWSFVAVTEEHWSDYGIPWVALADPGQREYLFAHLSRKPWFRPDKLNELLEQLEG